MQKLGLLIIARSSSKRFKNKIESKIENHSLLEILILRLLKSGFKKKKIVLCTSIKDKRNNFFKKIVKKYGIKVFYGSDQNIFSRIIECSKKYNFDHIVRLTGDNPFIYTKGLINLIKKYSKKNFDYGFMTNVPDGLKSEIFNLASLKFCKKNAIDQNSSEYLTYFFLRKIFKICKYQDKSKNILNQKVSFTIDYKKQLYELKKIIKYNKGDILIDKKDLVKSAIKLNFKKKIKKKKFIKLKCDRYNIKLKTDPVGLRFIRLSDFGIN